MKANEQDKIYCRSIRPDGYGEGVVPEIMEPRLDLTGFNDMYSDEGRKSIRDYQEGYYKYLGLFEDHLASLPVLYLIHPDLHKREVGWVGECREQYEIGYYPHPDEPMKWVRCTEKEYNDGNNVMADVRIVLVPVEGKAEENKPRCEKELHVIKYFGLPEDVSFNKVPKVTYADLVDLLFSWDETVKAKPTPVTGEAEQIAQWVIDNRYPKGEYQGMSDHELYYTLVDKIQAASRQSDAVEFVDWLKTFEPLSKEDRQWVLQSQISSETLYKIFKQQNTKP